MAEPVWGGEQDGGAPVWRFGVKEVKMEAHHHGGTNLMWRTRWRSSCVEVWAEGCQDGGPPSWWSLFWVEDKMAELPSGGFYPFGVEDKMAELLCGGLG